MERLASTVDVDALAADDDVIFRQRNRASAQRKLRGNEIIYPRLWFNAFHPDMVLLPGPLGPVEPPLGHCHSSLVLYAWHRGMSVPETVRLFSEPVFERLNFFRYWEPAKRALLEEGERIGFPLEGSLARWERHGSSTAGTSKRYDMTPNSAHASAAIRERSSCSRSSTMVRSSRATKSTGTYVCDGSRYRSSAMPPQRKSAMERAGRNQSATIAARWSHSLQFLPIWPQRMSSGVRDSIAL